MRWMSQDIKEPSKKTLLEDTVENIDKVVASLFVDAIGNPIKLAVYQRNFILSMLSRKYKRAIWVASTRIGKSYATAMLAILFAMLYDGEEIVVVAPDKAKSEIIFGNIREFVIRNHKLEAYVEPRLPFRRDQMHFVNGSVLRCISTGSEDSALGLGATILIIDEASLIKDRIWRTRLLRMMAGRAGRAKPIMILLGTPHEINFFYRASIDKEYWKQVTTYKEGIEAGILDPEEVQKEKDIMTDAEFRRWFMGEFIGEEEELVNMKILNELCCLVEERNPERGFEYIGAADIARMGFDQTAFVVLKIPMEGNVEDFVPQMVYIKVWEQASIPETAGRLIKEVEHWGLSTLVVDEAGLGIGAMDIVQEKIGGVVSGIKAIGNTREDIYSTMFEFINNRRILLLKDERIVQQMRSYKPKYRQDGKLTIAKSVGMHDDITDALAYACYAIRMERGLTFTFNEHIAKSDIFKYPTFAPRKQGSLMEQAVADQEPVERRKYRLQAEEERKRGEGK